MSAGLGCIGNVVFGRLSDFLAPAWDEERRSSRAKACPRRADSMLDLVWAWAARSQRSASLARRGAPARTCTGGKLRTPHAAWHQSALTTQHAPRLRALLPLGGTVVQHAVHAGTPQSGGRSHRVRYTFASRESSRSHGMRCARPQHRGARPPPLLAPLRCSPVELGPRWRVCFS